MRILIPDGPCLAFTAGRGPRLLPVPGIGRLYASAPAAVVTVSHSLLMAFLGKVVLKQGHESGIPGISLEPSRLRWCFHPWRWTCVRFFHRHMIFGRAMVHGQKPHVKSQSHALLTSSAKFCAQGTLDTVSPGPKETEAPWKLLQEASSCLTLGSGSEVAYLTNTCPLPRMELGETGQ